MLICKYKITVDINPRLALFYFNVTGCELFSTGIGNDQPSVVNSMQEGPTGIFVVHISRADLSANDLHDIVDHIPQKRILQLEINRDPIYYICEFTCGIRACVLRQVITTQENFRINKSQTIIK